MAWIRLSAVISLFCSKAKAVAWFKPGRIFMHACLWGKYLNKLKKLMLRSLISINLQYYNHSFLSYNYSQFIHSFPWEANFGVAFLGQSFSLYLRKLQNIIMLLYLSVFYMYTSSKWQFFKYIFRQTIVRRMAIHASESYTANCEGECQTEVFLFCVIWTLISWFL